MAGANLARKSAVVAGEPAERPADHHASHAVPTQRDLPPEQGGQVGEGTVGEPAEGLGGPTGFLLGEVGLVGRVHLDDDDSAEVRQHPVDDLCEDELRDGEVGRDDDAGTEVKLAAHSLPGCAFSRRGALEDLVLLDVVTDERPGPERAVTEAPHDPVGLSGRLPSLAGRQGRRLLEDDPHRPAREADFELVTVGAVGAHDGHDRSFPHLASSLLRLVRIDEG